MTSWIFAIIAITGAIASGAFMVSTIINDRKEARSRRDHSQDATQDDGLRQDRELSQSRSQQFHDRRPL